MVKNGFTGLLMWIAARLKGESYRIDPAIPSSALVGYAGARAFALLRGWLRTFDLKKWLLLGPDVALKNKRMIRFGRGVALGKGVIIDGLSADGIVLGDGASIGPYGIVRATGVLNSLGKGFSLGRHSSLDAFAFVGASGGVTIGDNVIVGQRVSFHSENHVYERSDVPIRHQGVTRLGIVVEDDCWIGANVTLLDGAHVASGCVIGAGSVVRGYIPPNSVAAGVPARVIKNRCSAGDAQ